MVRAGATRQCKHIHVGTYMPNHAGAESERLFFIINQPMPMCPCVDDRVMACRRAGTVMLNDTREAIGDPPDQKTVIININGNLKSVNKMVCIRDFPSAAPLPGKPRQLHKDPRIIARESMHLILLMPKAEQILEAVRSSRHSRQDDACLKTGVSPNAHSFRTGLSQLHPTCDDRRSEFRNQKGDKFTHIMLALRPRPSQKVEPQQLTSTVPPSL